MAVLIDEVEYLHLKVAEQTLLMLQAGGVDNWNWYYESLFPKGQETIEEYGRKLAKELGLNAKV